MKFFSSMKKLLATVLGFVLLVCGEASVLAEMPPEGPRVALRMSTSPEYELTGTITGQFDKRLLPLWMSALDQPDRDLHRQIADAIVRAKPLGLKGLDESVAAKLRKVFEQADHPVVRRSLARALIELDDHSAAEMLWDASQNDFQLALIVEPALGTWRYEPAIESAVAKLETPATAPPIALSAMELLANAQAQTAREPLLRLAQSASKRGDLRLAAATALGEIFSKGLASEARELSERDRSDDPLAGLLAVRLVARHQDEESIALVQTLANDVNTAVQAIALKRLGEIDHKLAARFAMGSESSERFSVKHPDANVRRALIESLYSISESEAIPVLFTFLDDPHPSNRQSACDALYHLAQKNADFRKRVDEQLPKALAESSWRTLEQASILVGGLDTEACADPLVELLPHERREVAVASAWALKELAVSETLPVVLKRLEENLATKYDFNSKAGLAVYERAQHQCRHLNEQLGLMKYAPAEPTLRRQIPLNTPPSDPPIRQINDPTVRATGIWALGLLHEGKPDPKLTAELMARLDAIDALYNSEPEIIGEAAAYAVGWMRDPSGLSMLKYFAGRNGTERSVNHACAWAIGRITGEPLPLGDPIEIPTPKWFLEPIGKPAD